MNWALTRIGVEPRPFRALLRASVWMDLRSQHYRRATRAGDSKLFTPLFWVFAQNLFVSLICSAVLFGRTDVFHYAMANIAVSVMMLASAVVVEFHEVVLNPDDAAVLAHLPIRPRTYAAVRLANLLVYVAAIGASLNVCPAVVGAWLGDASLLYLPAYVVAASAANVAAAGAVIAGYLMLARFVGHRRVKDALAYAQIGVTLVAVYGVQLLRRGSDERMLEFLREPPAWFSWSPPGWFAGLMEALMVRLPASHLWPCLAAIASLVAASWLTLWLLTSQYARVLSGGELLAAPTRVGDAATPAATRSRTDRFWSLVCWTRSEAAAARFCWAMATRDHDFKMRSIPSVGAAIGFFAIGILSGQLIDPFAPAGAGGDGAFAIIVPYFLVMAVPIVANNMLLSREHRAAWIFDCAPIRSPAVFVAGVGTVILWTMIVPLLAALAVGFAIAWKSPLHAAIHCFVALLLCQITLKLTELGVVRAWPFSRPAARGEVSGRTTLFVSAIMAGATAIGLVQRQVYREPTSLLFFLASLVVASVIVSLWARWKISRRAIAAKM